MRFLDWFAPFTNRFNLDESEILESRVSRMLFAGTSSAIALFVTHPLDVFKLNLQVKTMTMWEVVSYHYMKDKCIGHIYRGISSSMARSMVYCNMRFELYELARRSNLINSFERKVAVAAAAGGLGGFVVTPMYKVHLRIQNDDLLAPEERRYYEGLRHGLKRIYYEEGISMMFAGSLVSSFRGMMSTIAQIAFYDELKDYLLMHPQYFGEGFPMYIVTSVTAGFVATVLQQPFEVVGIKIMYPHPDKSRTTWRVVKEIFRDHGLAGFYKGLGPGFVRIIPQTVVTYIILESLRMRFGKLLKSRKKGDVIEIISIDGELVCDPNDPSCSEQMILRAEETKRKAKEMMEKVQDKSDKK